MRRLAIASLVIISCAVELGCEQLAGYSGTPADSAPTRDLSFDGPTDAAREARRADALDGPPSDGPQLDGPSDSVPDVPLPDAPNDVAPPDGPKGDTRNRGDLIISDLATASDFTLSLGCAPGAAPQSGTLWQISRMVICQDSSASLDQCSAEKLCNIAAGWRLCTASWYRTRGGTNSGSGVAAWLRSCTRNNGVKSAPTDQLCDRCTIQAAAATSIAWACSTGQLATSSSQAYLGVSTSSACRRLGVNSALTEAHWTHRPAAVSLNAAVCCKP